MRAECFRYVGPVEHDDAVVHVESTDGLGPIGWLELHFTRVVGVQIVQSRLDPLDERCRNIEPASVVRSIAGVQVFN